MRRTSRIVLSVLAAGSVAAAAACGSSSDARATSSVSSATAGATAAASTPAPAAAVTPTVVGADAVPAVTGAQGAKPAIAKGSAPAPTTLLAHDVITGTGPAVAAGSSVTVQYTLALYATGGLVQSSYDTGNPFTFPLGEGQVIPGFDAGVVGMQKGGRRELVIPPALGYGNQASAGIPAGSTLVFVVDLVSTG